MVLENDRKCKCQYTFLTRGLEFGINFFELRQFPSKKEYVTLPILRAFINL